MFCSNQFKLIHCHFYCSLNDTWASFTHFGVPWASEKMATLYKSNFLCVAMLESCRISPSLVSPGCYQNQEVSPGWPLWEEQTHAVIPWPFALSGDAVNMTYIPQWGWLSQFVIRIWFVRSRFLFVRYELAIDCHAIFHDDSIIIFLLGAEVANWNQSRMEKNGKWVRYTASALAALTGKMLQPSLSLFTLGRAVSRIRTNTLHAINPWFILFACNGRWP